MSEDSVLEMPCLGRPFRPGMLYDIRNDSLIPGVTLWNHATLTQALDSRPQRGSNFKVISEDSISDKAFHLGIDASLKLSFMGGLVNVSGSAEYLDDRKTSKNQARVCLKYWSTSRFDQLTMDQLGNVQYSAIFDDKTATHVVTGILYGADAFFIFDREVSHTENYRKVCGNMAVKIKEMPGICKIEGSASVNMNDDDKQEVDKFSCTFHGDLQLPENPTTFHDAVKIYRELPKLLGAGGEDHPHASVPKKVWLYPLSKLDSKAARLVREISINLVSQTQKVMEGLHELEMQANDLVKTEAFSSFPGIREQLSSFKEMIGEFKVDFSKSLTILLPQIRGGGMEEAKLAENLKAMHASPFNHQHLSSWLDTKEREVKVLDTYLQTLQGIDFTLSPGDLDAVVNNLNYTHVVCFEFKIAGRHNAFLKEMHAYLRRQQTSEEYVIPMPWHESRELMQDMKLQARQFQSFAKANAGKQDTKFIVANSSEEESDKCAVIMLYKDGMPEVFEPPGKPGKPIMSSATHCSIELKWQKPEYGSQNVEFYTVHYRLTEDPPEQWKTTKTEGAREFITVSDLAAAAVYCFKVRAECETGVSLDSEISDPIETNPPPVNRLAIRMLKESCCIEDDNLATYKLPIQEETKDPKGTISKCSLGRPVYPRPTERVLMIVGATGAGKTTLINGMINYILGVRWKDNFRFKLITEEVGRSQAHSQTSCITAYTLHKLEGSPVPYTLTIIDTPGFGDTKGLERDKEITSQIQEFFSISGPHGIDRLDGIGFVTQSDLARLTPTQQYVFDSILSIFGKDVAKNIFMMVTFADGQHPPVMTAIKEAKIPCAAFFKFNNSALFARNAITESDEDENFDEMFWKMGVKSFKKFFLAFEKAESKSLLLTKEVLNERRELETIIQGIQPQITEGLSQLDELRQVELVLQQREAEIETNKKFTFEVKITAQRTIDLPTGTYVTNCLRCNRTCHDDCAYANNEDKVKCAAMHHRGDPNKAACNICPGRCSWREHINNSYRFELYASTKTQTSDDLMQKYHTAVEGKSKVETMMAQIEAELEDMHIQVLTKIHRARKCLQHLDEIALKPNPLTEVGYLELLIQSEKDQAKPGFQQRIQYYEAAKEQAGIVAKVRDAKYIKTAAKQHGSKSWYARLRFW